MGLLSGLLGSLVVEIKSEGVSVVARDFKSVGDGLQSLAKQAQGTGTALAQAFAGASASIKALNTNVRADFMGGFGSSLLTLHGKLEKLAGGVADTFKGTAQAAQGLVGAMQPVTGLLTGFVMQGVQASYAGELINLQLAELSRQIASLFLPQIQIVIGRLGDVVRWFSQLSGAQQAGLRFWGLTIASLGTAAMILPKIIVSVQALGVAFQGVQLAVGALLANPWVLGLAALAAAIGVAYAAFFELKDAAAVAANAGKLMGEVFGDVRDVLRDAAAAAREMAGQIKEAVTGSAQFEEGLSDKINPWRNAKSLTPWMNWEGKAGGGAAPEWAKTAFALSLPGLLTGLGASLGRSFGVIPERLFEDQKARAREEEPRQELPPRLSGFEAVEATYRRISLASRNVGALGKPIAEQQLEEAKTTNEKLDGIMASIDNKTLVN